MAQHDRTGVRGLSRVTSRVPSSAHDRAAVAAQTTFGLTASQWRRVGPLWVSWTLASAATVLVQTAAFTAFLDTFGPRRLPLAYLAIAVVVGIAGAAGVLGSRRLSPGQMSSLTAAALTAVSLAAWAGLSTGIRTPIVFLLPAVYQGTYALSSAALWNLAGRLLDLQETKRLSGPIGSGLWAGYAAGGFAASLLTPTLSATDLLVPAAVCMAAAGGVQSMLRRGFRSRVDLPPGATRTSHDEVGDAVALDRRRVYLRLLLVVAGVWWIAFFAVDNAFLDRIWARYPTQAEAAGALGAFLGLAGLVSLLAAAFGAAPAMRRLGVERAVLVLPIVLLAAAGGGLVAGIAGAGAVLLVATLVAKLAFAAVGFSVDRSATVVLHQPLPSDMRSRTLTTAEGVAQPLGIGAAGLLLGALAAAGVPAHFVLGSAIVPLAVWLVAARGLGRRYQPLVLDAIAASHGRTRLLRAEDASSRAALTAALDSDDPPVVLLALGILEDGDPGVVADRLDRLLHHNGTDVRIAALQAAARLRAAGTADAARAAAAADPEPPVRAAAVRVLVAETGADALDSSLADDPSALVRIPARAALATVRDEALVQISALLGRHADERAEGAACASELAALAPERVATLVAPLCEALAANDIDARTTTDIVAAVAAAGDLAVAHIDASLTTAPGPRATVRLATCLGLIGTPAAASVALAHIEGAPLESRAALLDALSRCPSTEQISEWAEEWLALEMGTARVLCLLAAGTIGAEGAAGLVGEALAGRVDAAEQAILSAAAAADGSGRIPQIVAGMRSNDPDVRAYAIEAAGPVRGSAAAAVRVFGDPLSPIERLGRLGEASDGVPDPTTVIEAVATADALAPATGTWAQRCARFWLRNRQLPSQPWQAPKGMLSTIERVLALKTATVFRGAAGELLAEVAERMDERWLAAGEPVVRIGEAGERMYVIVSGEVVVDDGAREINRLGPGEAFGEMSLLDESPRAANVTTTDDTVLLALDGSTFRELVAGRPEIGLGVMAVLVARLRSLLGRDAPDVTQLSSDE